MKNPISKMKLQTRYGAYILVFGIWLLIGGEAGAAAPANGYIVRAESGTVYLDWGQASGVKANDRFQVFRAGVPLKHPVSGEVLGQAEENLATGLIDRVDEKFSVGHVSEPAGLRPGDRTRWLPPSQGIQIVPDSTTLETPGVVPMVAVAELWRSEPLEKEPVGLAVADLDGDGQKEIVVATRRKISVYHLKDKKLESAASFSESAYARWLAIETGDPEKSGRPKIFATTFLGGMDRPRVVILNYEGGKLKRTGELDGFVRAVGHADGNRTLYWQGLSREREVSFTAPAELILEKGQYKPGKTVDLKLYDDQLFGWTWGDFNKDGDEDVAILEHGDRLRVRFKDAKWKSSEVYGGTKNDFYVGDEKQGTFLPRLITWRPAASDRDQILIVTNRPDLGVRLSHLKLYRRSSFDSLQWNGVEMKPSFKLDVGGYVADYLLADLLDGGHSQLWTLVEGAGSKSLLISYSLP